MSFKPRPIVEVELSGAGSGWTDVSQDVLWKAGIQISRGIRGGGPTDLVESTGTGRFAMNNSASNSAGILGYYSPYHASHRAGWAAGIGCRIRMQDLNTSTIRTVFVGTIDAIAPEPGQYLGRAVLVTAVNWMDEAARWIIPPTIGEQVGKRYDEILAAIVALMPRQPTATSFDIGVEAYPYALDQSRLGGQYALSEFANLAASEFGPIYLKADGTLKGEGRHARLLDTTSDWTLTGADLRDLQLPSTRSEITNAVRVTIHPKVVDELPTTVIYEQASPLEIATGETKTVEGAYRDPVTGNAIGATSVQAQVAGTDYVANTSRDGLGADITADVTVTPTIGPNRASFEVTNANAATAYLTVNKLLGRGIYDFGTLQFLAGDETGVGRPLEVDMPYQADSNVGQGAADYIYAKYGAPFAQARMIQVPVRTPAQLAQALVRDISDRLDIVETVTGLSSSYFINGIDLSLLPSGVLVVSYVLAPAADPFAGLYWILGTSTLGTDTIPAPF